VYCTVEEIVDWKFWNKTSAPSPAASERPTDTYEASGHLLGMLMRADTPPFLNWKAPGVVFTPNVENVAQSATKGYLLALWFWVFAEKHGVVAARMARDTFCLLADEAQPSTGDILDNLVELQNRLIQSFDATPIEQRSFVQSGQMVTLPMEFFLATGFLLQSPDSPYYGRSGVDFEGNDIKLAGCLRTATEEALPLFKPMVQAIQGFDARTLPGGNGARRRVPWSGICSGAITIPCFPYIARLSPQTTSTKRVSRTMRRWLIFATNSLNSPASFTNSQSCRPTGTHF
jgi:hypothetical protein